MEIESLQPGRELDALIAERVFGLSLVKTFQASKEHPGKVGVVISAPKGAYIHEVDLPPYSTNIAAAWTVVEHFKMFEPCITYNDEMHCWTVSFHKAPDGITSAEKDMPLSLCLAVLKLVEKK